MKDPTGLMHASSQEMAPTAWAVRYSTLLALCGLIHVTIPPASYECRRNSAVAVQRLHCASLCKSVAAAERCASPFESLAELQRHL
ncbi:unnamed protein product, partial [Prorocentrum cordatum]